jgi:DNA-binding transcriptional LysR family regulator
MERNLRDLFVKINRTKMYIMVILLTMNSDANRELLHVLVTVAESRNFREAAERLKLSHAAVSLKLKALQEIHNVPLFSIEGRRKVLTHYGRALVDIGKASNNSLAGQIEDLDRMYSDPKNLVVRIGGRAELLETVGPELEFTGKIEFLAMASYQVLPSLQARSIDIGLGPARPNSSEIIAKKVFGSRAYLSFHQSIASGQSDSAILEDLGFFMETPSVGYIHERAMLSQWIEYLGGDVEKLNMKCRSDDWHVVRAMVEAGVGYSILPMYLQSHHPKVRQIEIPEKGIARLDFFALFHTHLRRVPGFKELLAFKKFPLVR